MKLIQRWRWRWSRKKRMKFFEAGWTLGYIEGDPEYWRQDIATPHEWLHLLEYIESEAEKDER